MRAYALSLGQILEGKSPEEIKWNWEEGKMEGKEGKEVGEEG